MNKITAAVLILALGTIACGSNPSAPTPTVTTTTSVPVSLTLSGTVTSTAGGGISGATVRILDGANAGKSTTTAAGGAYSITGLAVAGQTVNAAATNFSAVSKGVSTTSNQTVDFQLAPIPLFTIAGKGDNVFTIPTSVGRVHVTGHFIDTGSNSNFIVNFNGRGFINEILRTADYDGVLLTTGGGIITITSSGSIAWTFTEVR